MSVQRDPLWDDISIYVPTLKEYRKTRVKRKVESEGSVTVEMDLVPLTLADIEQFARGNYRQFMFRNDPARPVSEAECQRCGMQTVRLSEGHYTCNKCGEIVGFPVMYATGVYRWGQLRPYPTTMIERVPCKFEDEVS